MQARSASFEVARFLTIPTRRVSEAESCNHYATDSLTRRVGIFLRSFRRNLAVRLAFFQPNRLYSSARLVID